MFTVQQVLDGMTEIREHKIPTTDSPIYQAWAELADDWLANGGGEYHLSGFVGFNQRTPETIVRDLNNYDLITDPENVPAYEV